MIGIKMSKNLANALLIVGMVACILSSGYRLYKVIERFNYEHQNINH